MAEKIRRDFCLQCRKETEYTLKKAMHKRTVRGKEYVYESLDAICKECGEKMSIHGLMDHDNQMFDTAYRKAEGLVSIQNMQDMMRLYNLGKAPMSLALGFGEITMTRYLAGQMPSKEYSDIIKKALRDPDFMLGSIEDNKEKLGDTAYRKAMEAVRELRESMHGVSKKMISAIAYIFAKTEEITPLALQKLLYFSQGLNMAVNHTELFQDDCEAWVHGPVYAKVYDLFKEFSYNPIDDSKFVVFEIAEDKLSNEEKRLIDLILDTFGIYSGKALEEITHEEDPWKLVRDELDPSDSSKRIIPKEIIKKYFSDINEKCNLSSKNGINQYIASMIEKKDSRD
jgi:uncharacterized phage-associated protein